MNLTKFSEIISRIFNDSWVVILIITGILMTGPTKFPWFLLIPLFLALAGIVPATLYFLMKKGKISDWQITKREERHTYYAVMVMITLITVILAYFLVNFEFFVLDLSLLAVLLSLALATYIYKISGHMIINVSAVFLLNFLFDWKLWWLFAIVPVVAFARFYLKKHTVFQLLSGGIVGLAEPYLILKLFKLI